MKSGGRGHKKKTSRTNQPGGLDFLLVSKENIIEMG